MKIKERFNKKLLVEGNDDQHVVWGLCKKYIIPETFDVVDSEGIEKVFKDVEFRLSKQSNLDTLAVVVDADTDINARWDFLKNILSKKGYTLPAQPPADGLFIDTQIPKIGVWIMPNNQISGMLEDFIKFLIPQDDELLPIAEDVLTNNIEAKGLNRYKELHRPKALIHTWLAWQEEPGSPMGQAITKKYLQDTETCQLFVSWLKKIFA